jgi:UPF0271 protein
MDTVRAAIENGVQVGAHPSYPDRANFGRVSMRGQLDNLVEIIAEQIGVVRDELQKYGMRLSHVKAHGALYNDSMVHPDAAQAILDAVALASPGTPVLGLPGSALAKLCSEQGVAFIAEGYLDRAYTPDGTLVPRSQPGAVLNHNQALVQIQQLVTDGTVTTSSGEDIELTIQTLCVHADTPRAAETARDVKALLTASGVIIEAF